MSSTYRQDVFGYAKSKYGTEPEYLWERDPHSAVLRHKSNKKWYAIAMNVRKELLGVESDGNTDILNVKCDPILIGSLLHNDGYFPAYHMNKTHWITILLDGTVKKEEIFNLIDLSYDMTYKKKKR